MVATHFSKPIMATILFLSQFCLNAQTNNSSCTTHKSLPIIVVGVEEFENLVLVRLKGEPYVSADGEQNSIVTERKNMDSLPRGKKKFRQTVFDTNCYIITNDPFDMFALEYVIPNTPEECLPILNETYPKRFHRDKLYSIVEEKEYHYKCFVYSNIKHQKFVTTLVTISTYNEYKNRMRPRVHRFLRNKAKQGMYIKVLIPIVDDEE